MNARQPLNTSWMWRTDDGEVWGLSLDADHATVEWFDGIGCACGDSFAVQTFACLLYTSPSPRDS